MQWGDSLVALQEMQETSGMVPKALASRPTLNQYQLETYNAFVMLSAGRPYSMSGPLPIPITALTAYAALYDLSRDESQALWDSIRNIDSHWLSEVSARQKPKEGTGKT